MTPVPNDEAARLERESRTWGMLAHLCFYATFWMPFGGIVGTILIYMLRKHDNATARENARHALNFEITLNIAYVLSGIAYFAAFAFMFFTFVQTGAEHRGPARHGGAPPPFFFLPFVPVAIILLVSLAGAVTAAFAARTAWLGRVFRYPFAIPFVREDVRA